jgi:hypothetical protein
MDLPVSRSCPVVEFVISGAEFSDDITREFVT